MYKRQVLTPEVVAEHDGDTLGVVGHDPRHYVDIASDEHTATGYAARATAKYAIGSGSVYGNYETLAPGFTKIGQTSRQAMDVWRLGTQWPVSYTHLDVYKRQHPEYHHRAQPLPPA